VFPPGPTPGCGCGWVPIGYERPRQYCRRVGDGGHGGALDGGVVHRLVGVVCTAESR
jgi:hypothetical protein